MSTGLESGSQSTAPRSERHDAVLGAERSQTAGRLLGVGHSFDAHVGEGERFRFIRARDLDFEQFG